MSGAAAEKKPGTLVLAIGGRPKGGSYGASKESDDSGDSASYESEGRSLREALDKGDDAAIGAAMAKVAMRCMSDDSDGDE